MKGEESVNEKIESESGILPLVPKFRGWKPSPFPETTRTSAKSSRFRGEAEPSAKMGTALVRGERTFGMTALQVAPRRQFRGLGYGIGHLWPQKIHVRCKAPLDRFPEFTAFSNAGGRGRFFGAASFARKLRGDAEHSKAAPPRKGISLLAKRSHVSTFDDMGNSY